ncbi:hypothetical protein [Paraburkholderia strydomiana]|jgi:hypothetical protein|uniref:hypothetical protein n=1 Tax=Paraburkholderia strydomiana TaxID=1245417 RepID=UPI0038BAA950
MREYDKADEKWIEHNIGFWDGATDDSRGPSADAIAAWANRSGLTGVVWTSLPCKFASKSRYVPNEDEVVEHLRALNDSKRRDAEEYVRKAPAQIDIAYRRRIERELGWTYQK